ncbi:HpcH/HpaI aldolase [Sulfurimonas denitrificans DSM 1251]|uniref:HpcH/HpaI aldolase n=1 Tax=Sulfurimonas denitrificans (strain ATCC 33889 / DSM 1251) TaxID=326298 RepID=Q30RJ2_SULDN|nr:aldolase/citrate lyase family protein [Sulfurimonas denitrificans]ABB44389.1 HpcH/HpaI aldolase [Sulfurimonas denitrificans DSM 1251]MDD3442996.1 aldolase/citrate lyase family protein [Sulfurimonas denitrificans]
MINNLQEIIEAYESRDLKALNLLAVPTCRTLNKRADFRSLLMLSCNNLKHLTKIDTLEADAIILNLEDGVSKVDKPFALVLCAIFLSYYKRCDKKLIVRVNALNEGGYDEIAYLKNFMPDAIRVPKIRDKKEVESVCELLDEKIELHLSIETKEAWNSMLELRVDKNVTTFYLGILDIFADMKLSQTLISRENPVVLYMLSHFLISSKSIGVKPVSFVYQEFKKLPEFEMWLSLEKSMGYDAKGCLSPTQASIANRVFTSSEAEIKRAEIIVKLFELKQEEGISGFEDKEFGFIDEPIYKGALATLNKNV